MKTLQYYTETDAKTILEQIPEIVKKANREANKLLEPTIDEYYAIQKIVKEFIQSKQRIIYGGYALNAMLLSKDKNAGFYDEDDTPDIEFFSDKPIEDLYALCNILHDAGFKYVQGTEAQHHETYTIFVNFKGSCDITYVPTNVYKHMRVYDYDGFRYIHPHVIAIDQLRVMNDPMTSFRVLEKTFKRMIILQKYFPFVMTSEKLRVAKIKPNVKEILFNMKIKLLTELKDSFVLVGFEAYNYYVAISQAHDEFLCMVPYIEGVSTNYIHDVITAYKFVESYATSKDTVTHEEYTPFFQYTGYKSIIYLNGDPLIIIYHHNNMCIPYNRVKLKYTDGKEYIHLIGTFTYMLMFCMFTSSRARVDRDKQAIENYGIMISNLMQCRNEYLCKHKLSPLDSSPFRELNIQCMGSTVTPDRKKRLKNKRNKDAGKKFNFSYYPEGKSDEERKPSGKFKFDNTSGNLIINDRNKKVNVKLAENAQGEDAEPLDDDENTEESPKPNKTDLDKPIDSPNKVSSQKKTEAFKKIDTKK